MLGLLLVSGSTVKFNRKIPIASNIKMPTPNPIANLFRRLGFGTLTDADFNMGSLSASVSVPEMSESGSAVASVTDG